MKRQLILLLSIALLAVPAMLADHHLDGVQTVSYDVLLSPSHETPPIEGVDASGQATVEFIVMREAGMITAAWVDFHVNWRSGLNEELQAMHIHRGAAGVPGPVVINANLGAQAASSGGMIFRQEKVMNAELIEEIMANPAGFYLNVHSVSNPSGLIRGQLKMDATSELKRVESNLRESLEWIESVLSQVHSFPRRK